MIMTWAAQAKFTHGPIELKTESVTVNNWCPSLAIGVLARTFLPSALRNPMMRSHTTVQVFGGRKVLLLFWKKLTLYSPRTHSLDQCDRKDIYNVTKDSFFKQMQFFSTFCSSKNPDNFCSCCLFFCAVSKTILSSTTFLILPIIIILLLFIYNNIITHIYIYIYIYICAILPLNMLTWIGANINLIKPVNRFLEDLTITALLVKTCKICHWASAFSKGTLV